MTLTDEEVAYVNAWYMQLRLIGARWPEINDVGAAMTWAERCKHTGLDWKRTMAVFLDNQEEGNDQTP